MNTHRYITVVAVAVCLALAAPSTATAAEPCAPGTPSALAFMGLPDRVAFGKDVNFSFDFDHQDWDVEGNIHVAMHISNGDPIFEDDTTDPFAEYWLRMERDEKSVTVTATFEQFYYGTDTDVPPSCTQTLSQIVVGYENAPRGYKDCGWKVFSRRGGWTYSPEPGVYLHLFARKMSCRAARRNYRRVRYPAPQYEATRNGYRCVTLDDGYEYSDVRCAKNGRPKVAFRWQTGA
jgi:hypothetical protein